MVIAGDQKPLVALEITADGANLATRVAWESKDLRPYLTTPVVMDDHLVGLDNRTKRLVCVDMATSEAKWFGDRSGMYASLVVAGKRLLALSSEGQLLVLQANPQQYEKLAEWTVSEEGGTFGHLAMAGRKLFIKDREHLMCFELAE